jgi:O-antigen/teichoic acid export membrane protein
VKAFNNVPKFTYLRSYSSIGKKAGKNFGWLFIGNLGSLALGFITTMYLARFLGQSEFGKFSYAQTLTMYGALLVDLGLNVYGNRSVASNPKHAGRYLINIGSLQIFTGLLLIIIVTTIIYTFKIWLDSELQVLVAISLLWVLPFALNIEWFFLGSQKMDVVAFGRLIQQCAIIFITYLLVKGPEQVVYAPIARVAGGMASALWLFFRLPKGILQDFRIHLSEAAGYLRTSKWFWLSAFLVQVYNGADIVILQLFRPAGEVGLYSAGFRLIGLFVAAIVLLNMVMFPMLAAEYGKNAVMFAKLLRLHLLTAVGIAFMLLVVALPTASLLVNISYGSQYLGSVSFLRILIIAASVLTLNGAIAQPLLASGYEVAVFKQISFTALVNVVLNLILIPHFGAYGAALTYLISVIFATAWLIPIYYKRMGDYLLLPLSITDQI